MAENIAKDIANFDGAGSDAETPKEPGSSENHSPNRKSDVAPRNQGPGPEQERGKPRVFMDVSAGVTLDPSARIDTARGLKLKFDYNRSSEPNDLEFYPKSGPSIKGQIVGGSDWVLIRRDGVIVFDGRITLSFDPPDKKEDDEVYILDTTIKGMLDLSKHLSPGHQIPSDRIFDQFVRGKLVFEAGGWPVRLSMRFEGSDVPAPREDTSWLSKRLQYAIERAALFRDLLRQQFWAIGTVTTTEKEEPFCPPSNIKLKVWGDP